MRHVLGAPDAHLGESLPVGAWDTERGRKIGESLLDLGHHDALDYYSPTEHAARISEEARRKGATRALVTFEDGSEVRSRYEAATTTMIPDPALVAPILLSFENVVAFIPGVRRDHVLENGSASPRPTRWRGGGRRQRERAGAC